MNEAPSAPEGVIQFKRLMRLRSWTPFDLKKQSRELNEWRFVLKQFGWLGQAPDRYDGLGFGNLSVRVGSRTSEIGHRQFLISGSQTGHLPTLPDSHIAWISAYTVMQNEVTHATHALPSSETLTHAAIYDSNANMRACIHVHCPVIWNNCDRLNLPYVPKQVPYGTVEMARNILDLQRKISPLDPKPIVMKGHEDGVICGASSLEVAFLSLLNTFRTSSA
ncbi:MAG: class II aldolase/adducin family protein [Bradymonadia bacterium]